MMEFTLSLVCSQAQRHEQISRVLDAYAWRVARDAWQAYLSEEGLSALQRQVRPLLTRKSALVCRDSRGVRWQIGARTLFNRDGLPALSRRFRIPHRASGDALRIDALGRAVALAGQWHDLGKNTTHFAWKLQQSKPIADAVRHEVLSWAQVRSAGSVEDILSGRARPALGFLQGAGHPGIDGLDYLVLTHHRLFAVDAAGRNIDLQARGHVNPNALSTRAADLSAQVDDRLAALRSPQSWYPANMREAVFARLSLMLADHFVSGLTDQTPGALAAAARRHLDQPSAAKANKNQSLAGHLSAVGRLARVTSRFLLLQRWRWVLPVLDVLLAAPAHGRFAWQEEAAAAAAKAQGPALVLLCAATGTGKTQAAARIVQAMHPEGVRMTVALGLRTLTLQTGEVYRQRFGLDASQLRVLIGSNAILRIHESLRDDPLVQEPDLAAAEDELKLDVPGAEDDALPAPLSGEFRASECGYLKTPVLITTVDQIIKAADHRDSGWIKPFLRLMSAPIVLDEIDGYDTNDLPALWRLVYFAGLVGQTVIASSATIYPAVAQALVDAHASGLRDGGHIGAGVMLCGHVAGTTRWVESGAPFEPQYRRFCADLCASELPKRIAQPLELGNPASKDDAHALVAHAIWKHALHLHAMHAIQAQTPEGPTRISVGLVRIAHIRHLVPVARVLDEMPDDEKVDVALVVYHSRNTLAARSEIERRLDRMLQRNDNPLAPLNDAHLRERAARCARWRRELCVLVLATPVEEVGRDHDFDWAIIEPSSARSVVQACGRVLRHRDTLPSCPNVAILDENFAALTGQQGPVFCRPGFETAEHLFGTRQAWPLLACDERPTQVVSAAWCLTPPDQHMAAKENQALQAFADRSLRQGWLSADRHKLVSNHYTQYGFRRCATNQVTWQWDPFDPANTDASWNDDVVLARDELGVMRAVKVEAMCPRRSLWKWRIEDYARHVAEMTDRTGLSSDVLGQIPMRSEIGEQSAQTIDPLWGSWN